MTPRQADDWKDLAEKASKERDPRKLRVLVEELLYALSKEQRHVKDEIASRLDYHYRATDASGIDPSGSDKT